MSFLGMKDHDYDHMLGSKQRKIEELEKEVILSLGRLYSEQLKQQEKHGWPTSNLDSVQKLHALQECGLGLQQEVSELFNGVKGWKTTMSEDISHSNVHITNELADILKYLLVVAIVCDISPEELVEAFNRKTVALDDRVHTSKNLENVTDCIVLDIDGVVADEKACQNKFMEENHRLLDWKTWCDDEEVGGLEGREREEFLIAFRESGYLENCPVINGAPIVLQELSKKFNLVYVTSRPFAQYPSLHAETVEFFKKNGIPCSALISNSDKSEAMALLGLNPVVCIDDRIDICSKLASRGYKTIWFAEDCDVEYPDQLFCASDWVEVLKIIEGLQGD